MLDAGAPSRRERLWASFTNAAGAEPDFCIQAGALAEVSPAPLRPKLYRCTQGPE